MLSERIKPYKGCLYFTFRVLVGLLFVQHGAQKLFGAFGSTSYLFGGGADLISLMTLAGFIEFFGGLAIVFGLFTRLAALLSGFVVLIGYFMAHAPQGVFPIVNKGELALLYFAVFLVLLAYGSGKWSLEKTLLKKEIF